MRHRGQLRHARKDQAADVEEMRKKAPKRKTGKKKREILEMWQSNNVCVGKEGVGYKSNHFGE